MRELSPIMTGALLLTLLTACATAQGELAPRHAPSGLETPLPQADFAAYVDQARTAIAAAHAQIGQELPPEAVEQHAPFELVPDPAACPRTPAGHVPRAALLIHGLGGTPYEMQALGRRLAADCYLVRAILLPGHGTVPGDLLEASAEDWRSATAQGVASFAGAADEVVLVGFSEGGTLALDYALAVESAGAQPMLAGLVLLAPVLAPQDGFAGRARRYLSLGGLASAHAFEPLLPDDDPLRYDSIARNAQLQAGALGDRVAETARLLDVPAFMALSAEDAESDAAVAQRWFCRQLVGPRQLVWYAGDVAPVGDCRLVEARPAGVPPEILDLAHRALPIAAADPHYGRAGDYLDCRHYYYETDTPNWLICLDEAKTPANSAIRYGEVTEPNLDAHVMRRLTWNPDFTALSDDIVTFLDEAPWPSPPLPTAKPTM